MSLPTMTALPATEADLVAMLRSADACGAGRLMAVPQAPGSWQVQRGRPHPGLRPHVLSYTGYAEYAQGPMRRMEVPTTAIPLIVSLGPSLLVNGVRHGSFAAGIDDAVAITEYAGEQLGIQVDVTPLGARRLLGLPMGELARRVVPLEALLGPGLHELVERLNEAPDWAARFALLDVVLLARLQRAPRPAPEVEHAWARLHAAGGAVPVGALATETGWSRRHLTARFSAEVGLAPKAIARILRFERVTSTLRAQRGARLAEIAYACGYADQAHLNRDFRAFAGTTPTDFVARLLPDGAGVAAEQFPNVQDGLRRAA
jgi:AraC-like DNA-binding protein